jgi:putative nucleotidyltransferase-like protein
MATDPSHLLRAGATLALDALTAELLEGLRADGIEAIVLKGPALAHRLYAGEGRAHEDIDVLVSPAMFARAEALLARQGFSYAAESTHARAWIRRHDGVTVDLHRTLLGVGIGADEAWTILSEHVEPIRIGRGQVDRFTDVASAVHVALHAAQHGHRGTKSSEDLERAISRFGAKTWEDAAALATRLQAIPGFAAGLRLLPEGADLAERLSLPTGKSFETALHAGSPPPTALGFVQLGKTPGLRAKLALLRDELAPTPSFMRALYPVARRGPLGLAASYVWRPAWLLWRAGPAIRAIRLARREVRD